MDEIEKTYEDFVRLNPAGTFFQSGVFGKFQESLPGRGKTWQLIVSNKEQTTDDRKVDATCLAVRQKLPLNKCWLWVPYGPLGFKEEIFEDLALLAKEENAVFARIEPSLNWKPEYAEKLKKDWRVRSAKNRYTPECSLIINLQNAENEILAQMKPKGRYNIKLAEKKGVICRKIIDLADADFDNFYKLLAQTSKRDGFGIHPKSFYKTLLKTFGAETGALYLAYWGEKAIAGIIVIFYKDTATYYYGASDYRYRALMAPYLLQWTAMQEAKKRGMKFYDLFGIAPLGGAKNHPWQGVTEFKRKFGGREIKYPPAFDVVYKPLWYKGLCAVKKLLKPLL